MLLDINVEVNEDHFLISSLTRACQLINDQVRTRLPIQRDMLNILLKKVREVFSTQPFLSQLYQALFVAGYYGLLRVGELTMGNHPIYARDVRIGVNKKKILFILRTSKTTWKDTSPQMVKITSAPRTDPSLGREKRLLSQSTQIEYCPFNILDTYRKMRGPAKSAREQFFVFSDGSRVKSNHMRTVLKRILTLAGFDESCYGTHSLRIGRSVDMLKYGLSVETIKKLGRWKSNTVFKYLRCF